MQQSDLRAASDFANNFGAKCIIYGPPGSAKTPLINSAPRPVLLACETGLLSMRGSNVPTWGGFTVPLIEEFFKWFESSAEVKNFDTIAIDSASHMADIYLQAALSGTSQAGNKKHGQAAYGDMATKVSAKLRTIYYTRYKHAYVICKEAVVEDMGVNQKRPYFPGNVLNTEIPHQYDFILRLAKANIPSVGEQLAFQCNQTYDVSARNRTGTLDNFEPPHYGNLITKALA